MDRWEEIAIVGGTALGIGFLAVFAAIGFAKTASASSAPTTPQPASTSGGNSNYIVTPLNVGQTFDLHVGDTLSFQLPVPPAGDTWAVTPSTPATWDLEGTGTGTNTVGVAVDTFTYSPTQTGSSTITMALMGSANYQIGVGYTIHVNVT